MAVGFIAQIWAHLIKTGPHGYIHGWIYVGPHPSVGQLIHQIKKDKAGNVLTERHGTIDKITDGHVHIAWHDATGKPGKGKDRKVSVVEHVHDSTGRGGLMERGAHHDAAVANKPHPYSRAAPATTTPAKPGTPTLTPAEHVAALRGMDSREQAHAHLSGLNKKTLQDISRHDNLGVGGTKADLQRQLVETYVGRRIDGDAIRRRSTFKPDTPPAKPAVPDETAHRATQRAEHAARMRAAAAAGDHPAALQHYRKAALYADTEADRTALHDQYIAGRGVMHPEAAAQMLRYVADHQADKHPDQAAIHDLADKVEQGAVSPEEARKQLETMAQERPVRGGQSQLLQDAASSLVLAHGREHRSIMQVQHDTHINRQRARNNLDKLPEDQYTGAPGVVPSVGGDAGKLPGKPKDVAPSAGPKALKPREYKTQRSRPGEARVGDLMVRGNDSSGYSVHQVSKTDRKGRATELYDPATGNRTDLAAEDARPDWSRGERRLVVPAEHFGGNMDAPVGATAGRKFESTDDVVAALRPHLSPDSPQARRGEYHAQATRLVTGDSHADVADHWLVQGAGERYQRAAGEYDAALLSKDPARITDAEAKAGQALREYMDTVGKVRGERVAQREADKAYETDKGLREWAADRGMIYHPKGTGPFPTTGAHYMTDANTGEMASSFGMNSPEEILAKLQGRSPGSSHFDSMRQIRTRDRFTPTDAQPHVFDIVGRQFGGRRWDTANRPGARPGEPPTHIRSTGGWLDNRPVSAEIHNPVSKGGNYRWEIRDDETGKLVERGFTPHLHLAHGRADRIFSSQRGEGMARTHGKRVAYEVRPAPTANAPHGHDVYEIDQEGNARLHTSSITRSRAQEQADKLEALEEARLQRDSLMASPFRAGPTSIPPRPKTRTPEEISPPTPPAPPVSPAVPKQAWRDSLQARRLHMGSGPGRAAIDEALRMHDQGSDGPQVASFLRAKAEELRGEGLGNGDIHGDTRHRDDAELRDYADAEANQLGQMARVIESHQGGSAFVPPKPARRAPAPKAEHLLPDDQVKALNDEWHKLSRRAAANRTAANNGSAEAQASIAADRKRMAQIRRRLNQHYAARDAAQAAGKSAVAGPSGFIAKIRSVAA